MMPFAARPAPSDEGAIATLLHITADEAEALRTADLAALESLAARKEALIAELGQLRPDGTALAHLRARLQANAQLYEAALGGIAQARARLSAVATGRAMLKTYDRSGRLAASGQGAATVTRRA